MTSQAAAAGTVSQLAGQVGSVSLLSRSIADAPAASGGQVPLELRLPTLTLPVFNGDRKSWASFKDLFESCIHSKNLKDSVKLQYLLSHLDGEAKQLVSAFTITDANYVQVWDKLNEFYDKKKYTVAALVKDFVDQPPVTAPTLVGLRTLASTSDEVVRQLKALGEEYESRDPWLIHLLLEKLDRETRSLWAQKLVDLEYPTFQDFITFLERRCDALETCASFSKKGTETTIKKEHDRRVDHHTKTSSSIRTIQSFHASTQQPCPQCSEAHSIYQCHSFKEMPVNNRRELVQRAKLCFNCLKATHFVKGCTSTVVCKQCKQKHHSLLCTTGGSCASGSGQLREEAATAKKQQASTAEEPKEADSVASYVAGLKTSCPVNFQSLLPTAVVKVLGRNNVFHEVRAMVDSACMNTLISKEAFERLGLERRNASILVSGITDEKPSKTTGAVTLQISSRFDDRVVIVVEALILNHLVSDQPSQQFDVDAGALTEASLADPGYNERGKIDILLGIDAFFSILEPEKLYDTHGTPIAQNSVFGYLVGGQFNTIHASEGREVLCLSTSVKLDQTLRKFPEVEESKMDDSVTGVIRRFKSMERSFCIDPELLATELHSEGRSSSWLSQAEDNWSAVSLEPIEEVELVEERATMTCSFANAAPPPSSGHETQIVLLNRLRSYDLARRNGVARLKGPLTPKEVNDACLQLRRTVQHEGFQKEFDFLVKNIALPGNSNLKTLLPFSCRYKNGSTTVAWELARIVATHSDRYEVAPILTVRREKEYQRAVHNQVPLLLD